VPLAATPKAINHGANVARKFLIIIAVIIGLILLAGIGWSMFSDRLMRAALVPGVAFVGQKPVASNAYADRKMWIARPDIAGNPALWKPAGFTDGPKGEAAIFFIHPTSYIQPLPKSWNASLDDATTNGRAKLFVQGQASALNNAGDIWAPRYRQANFGAFLTSQPEAQKALDAAYADVEQAWAQFLAEAGPDRPIIVAGHSQGSVHLLRLLRERVAGQAVAKRIVAAYVIGWPVSVTADLPKLGLPSCATADQSNCILSWQSFAEPADTTQISAVYDATTGFTGQSRRGTKMLCTNPLTGIPDTGAGAPDNEGTIIPNADLTDGTLETHQIPARCDARGFLLIGLPPEKIGAYVLPGNNYHVFDYSLFWANIRIDADRRLKAFSAK
jgi:Protein of unknown function (DUF3089)